MKGKKTQAIIIIAALAVVLGALWTFIIIGISNQGSNSVATNGAPSMMNNSSSVSYSSAKEITTDEDITGGEYSSSTADENAISVSGNIKSTISDVSITKTGDSNGGDNTSFYGTNSAIIAKGGANLTIKNASITTNATGANAVFSYGGSATTNNSSSDGHNCKYFKFHHQDKQG